MSKIVAGTISRTIRATRGVGMRAGTMAIFSGGDTVKGVSDGIWF